MKYKLQLLGCGLLNVVLLTWYAADEMHKADVKIKSALDAQLTQLDHAAKKETAGTDNSQATTKPSIYTFFR